MKSGSKRCVAYDVSLFLGSVNEETGESFTKKDLRAVISSFQDQFDPEMAGDWTSEGHFPVRITDTEFVSGAEYWEEGWQVTAIQYPKATAHEAQIFGWMSCLAKHLCEIFKQKRICVMDSGKVVMFGGEDGD
jgi:hypothetical protein